MINAGLITVSSVGGSTGGGSVSGITSLNSQTGPAVTLTSTDLTIGITNPTNNVIDFSCSGFVSGVQQQIHAKIDASGQTVLSVNNASGQYILSHINGSGQYLLNELSVSGQTILSVIAGSGQELLSNVAASGQQFIPKTEFDWNGFSDRDDSTISFDEGTLTFSIQPTGSSFDYYVEGAKYVSAGDTVAISNTEGIHVIYYDGPTLSTIANPNAGQVDSITRTKALVGYVYWGAVQGSGIYVGEERHGRSMSPLTHTYLHFTEGLRYVSPGLGLNNITADGTGDADDFIVFGVDAGAVSDEDIYSQISAVGSGIGLPLYYMRGATPSWIKHEPSGFSMTTLDGTRNTRLAYNQYTGGAWQLTEVDNGDFVLCHVFATTEKDNPMIAILGQNEYNTRALAEEGATTELRSLILNDILFPEIKPVATVIFQTRNIWTNSLQARIVTTEDGDDYVDWRNETISRVGISVSDHNALNGLQGGAAGEYYHLTSSEHDKAKVAINRYYGYFKDFTEGNFSHNLNTEFYTWSVFASGTTVEPVMPDEVSYVDDDTVNLKFNSPQTGFMVIMG